MTIPNPKKPCCSTCDGSDSRHRFDPAFKEVAPCTNPTCDCHRPDTKTVPDRQTWEERFDTLVEGRKNSKFHKNYIAIHVVRTFISTLITEAREEERKRILAALPDWESHEKNDNWENGQASALHVIRRIIENKD